MVSENIEQQVEELLSKHSRSSQAYWDFASQEEREQFAWLAGIIDGEGTIRAVAAWNKTTRNLQHDLYLSVFMTHKPTVKVIKETAGVGQIYPQKPGKLGKKMGYRWVCANRQAALILRQCLHYLVTKQPQAVLALEFMEIKKLSGQRPTAGQLGRREALIKAISRLNH